ncbi:MAG TPA: MFS transporter [Bryobacteraceae bacterium]|nr:MFS transporter [Bryobacteraceae bacterium]
MSAPAQNADETSGWAPLRRPLFRNRWLASIVSSIGSWMQDTAGTWLMTSLTTSPLLIALVQTAASLPVLLLGLIAGATADIYDRRRLLIFWQTWMLAAVFLLSVLTVAGLISPGMLLSLTFLLNIGAAMTNPAWQAIVPELVPRSELADAIAINSAGFNLARALGPALGGLLVAAFVSTTTGAGTVFFLNSASFVAVIFVLYTWKRTPLFKSALPAERVFGSIRAGLRYLWHAPPLQAVLVRAFLFTGFVSAAWALLAVVAQQHLHQGAMGYGILNACMGAGAVIGAASLPKLRRRFEADHIVEVSSVVFAGTLFTLAFTQSISLIVLSLIAAGFAWTSTTSTFNVAVQLSVPAWVQARALGTYQMIFQGGMALGSAAWGFWAQHVSTSNALMASGIGLLISIVASRRFHLLKGELPDLNPYSLNRPAPQVVIEPRPEDGPVLITVEYRIRRTDYDDFTRAIHQLREVRMRDGAIRWGIYQDTAEPDRMTETFVVESWIEYLRQRERLTAADRLVRDRVWSFHTGASPPVTSHMIYARQIADELAKSVTKAAENADREQSRGR